MDTPSQPRVTRPAARSWSRMGRARSVGMAKPMPWNPPSRLAMVVAMPMTSPRVFTTGPPELPGLMAASVWMKSSNRPAPITRLLPLMNAPGHRVIEPEGVADRHHRIAHLRLPGTA
jgi:hypothetical protein